MTFIVPRPFSHASPRSMGPAAAAAAAASDASDENDDERCNWELSNHQDLSAAAPALPAATEGSGVAQAPITTIPCSAPAPAPLLLLCYIAARGEGIRFSYTSQEQSRRFRLLCSPHQVGVLQGRA